MKLINALGYAGLLPFALLPLAYHLQWGQSSPQLLQLYQLYSALILGFMAGVIWPVLYQPASTTSGPGTASSHRLALLAVSFPVLSIVTLALFANYFLLLQALLFILLRVAEYASGIEQRYSKTYRRLRNRLTLVVSLSHLLLHWLINAG